MIYKQIITFYSNYFNTKSEICNNSLLKIERSFFCEKSGKAIIALILAAAVALTVGIVAKKVASSPKKQIKETVAEAVSAYNSADMDGLISCFEPAVQSVYKGANSLLNSTVGFDIGTISSLLPFASYLDEDIPDASELPKLDISVDDIDVTSDSTAVVYCTVQFGSLEPESSTMNMVKVDDKWYFAVDSLF